MIARSALLLAALAFVATYADWTHGADEGVLEAHGSGDAYAAPGIAMAWGVLRGADESATAVVLRIDLDPLTYATIAIDGVDPFTRKSKPLLPSTAVTGTLTFASSRARFADYPRTELRFGALRTGIGAKPATLLVYFLGLPDTTPEFDDANKLDAYLADRVARARQEVERKPR